MSADTTSSLLVARQPVIPEASGLFESTNNPVDIQQPPPHVVDYWFDRLGLSLDPTPSENPSNATSFPFQFPLLDGTSHVSSLLSTSCRTTFFRLVYALRGFLIGFH